MTGAAASGHPRAAAEALLWDLTDSPFCAKARMCLHLKRVSYRRLTLTVGRLRALKRLNPRGQVPVLVLEGRAIVDSSAIARHLEAEVPGHPLLPPDPAARAYCDLVEEWADEALYPLVGAIKWLDPANRAAAVARTVPELAGRLPHWLVTRALMARIGRRLRAQGVGRNDLSHLIERLRGNVTTLAGLLGERSFLLGKAPTLADLAVFAQLACLRGYAEEPLLAEQPNVARWIERMDAVPAIGAALG